MEGGTAFLRSRVEYEVERPAAPSGIRKQSSEEGQAKATGL